MEIRRIVTFSFRYDKKFRFYPLKVDLFEKFKARKHSVQ
jgi:hypothetical protein